MQESGLFSRWFEANSGYALHPPRRCKLTGCCADRLERMAQMVDLPAPQSSQPHPYRLYRCTSCKRMYAKYDAHFVEIANLLKYRITNE